MRPFEDLTNAGKGRRLRTVAAAALERYDLRVRRLRLITNEFNAVFRVDADAGRTYVLRVNLPNRRSLAEIEAEMSWLNALANGTAVGVPTPVLADGGDLVVTVSAAGVPEPRHCTLFRWIGGVDLAARLTEENVAELGALSQDSGRWVNEAIELSAGVRRVYRKRNLAHVERPLFAAGVDLPIFATGRTQVGVQLCRELRFPEQVDLTGSQRSGDHHPPQ